MSENLPIQGIRPVSDAAQPKAAEVDAKGGAQFRALLDRLQREAASLQNGTDGLADPEALAGAVDQAGSTLADAKSLGDQLLEAYRAARQVQSDGKASA